MLQNCPKILDADYVAALINFRHRKILQQFVTTDMFSQGFATIHWEYYSWLYLNENVSVTDKMSVLVFNKKKIEQAQNA